MDIEKLSSAGIDVNGALERFAGNTEIYEKYLNRFQTDTHMSFVKDALAKKDYESILQHAHAMKGLTGTLGMNELYQTCSVVVSMVRNQDFSSLSQAIIDMENAYQKIMSIYK